MKREDFLKIVPAPGMCMVEAWDNSNPCSALYSQFCRLLAVDPRYAGPIDVGARVVISQSSDRHLYCDESAPDGGMWLTLALIPIEEIVGVAKS